MGLADEMMMSAVSADNHSPAEAEVHKQQGQPPENNSSKLMSSSSASTDITAIKAAAKEEVLKSSSGGTTTFTAAAAAAPPTPLGLNNGSSSAHSPSFGNSRADVSSEDIDVMSTPQRSDLLNGGGPGGGEDEVGIVKPDLESSPTRHIVGINSVLPVNSNGMLVKKEAPTPTHTSEHSGPEPDLAARLKRFKTVVLGALFKHSKSVAFREPVNAKALGIWPAYPNIIKHPMDLGTIRKKCDRVLYNTRAEAIADLNQVWINAQTFNKPGHFVYEQSLVLEGVSKAKIKKLEADEASGVYDAKPVIAASHHHHHGIHTTPSERKRSPATPVVPRSLSSTPSLPQGHHLPTTPLPPNRQENIPEKLQAVEAIINRMMRSDLPHCAPFIGCCSIRGSGMSIDLERVKMRLSTRFYVHPLQVANDVRRIVTETYRNHDEESGIIRLAGDFQHQFEREFSKIDIEPVPNPAIYDIAAQSGTEDYFHKNLVSARNQVNRINDSIGRLVADSLAYKSLKRGRYGAKKTNSKTKPKKPPATPRPRNNHNATTGTSNAKKRGRPPGSLNQTPPLSKRPKPNPPAVHSQQQQGVLPNGNGSAPHIQNQLSHNPPQAEPIVIPVEESMALRQEVATLTEDQQQHVVNIMFKNNESLVEDKHGYTEIDLGICRPSTVREIQAYIQSLRAPPPPPPPQQQQPPPPSHQSSSVIQSLKQVRKPNVQSKKSSSGSRSNSPVKAPKEQNGRLSDSSSDSSDDDDDDSSSGSSSSDSDSE